MRIHCSLHLRFHGQLLVAVCAFINLPFEWYKWKTCLKALSHFVQSICVVIVSMFSPNKIPLMMPEMLDFLLSFFGD